MADWIAEGEREKARKEIENRVHTAFCNEKKRGLELLRSLGDDGIATMLEVVAAFVEKEVAGEREACAAVCDAAAAADQEDDDQPQSTPAGLAETIRERGLTPFQRKMVERARER